MFNQAALQKGEADQTAAAVHAREHSKQQDMDPDEWLLCGICGNRIARTADRVAVEGQHEHRHVNPEGIAFHIGCFAGAPGGSPVGEESSYFSWFRGYSWRVLLCTACGLHLGWLFVSSGHQFHGLILSRMVQEQGNISH